jgi:hypothetical protein
MSATKPLPLLEKMLEIYKTVDFIPKNGYNKSQSYKFMRAADVVIELRKNLIAQRVYVEVNYGFSGPAYTIAREKAPNAPFSAVSVVCTLVFHDLDSTQTLTASGVGTGCDTNDKAGYKAMTGALKYALKNAFLVPDEADPEGDESVEDNRSTNHAPSAGDGEMPNFQESKHEAAKPAPARKKAEPAKQDPTPAASGATAAATSPAPAPAGIPPANKPNNAALVPQAAPETTSNTSATSAQREPGDEDATIDTRLPSESELDSYRKAFQKLGDDLSTTGGLKSSPKLPIERKLLVFLLGITGADAAKNITNDQWKTFFARVEAGKNSEQVGLKGIAVLVNRASGIEPKEKASKK